MRNTKRHFSWRKFPRSLVAPGWRCIGLALLFMVFYGLPVRCELARSQLQGTVFTLSSSGRRLYVPGVRVALECFESSSNSWSTETSDTGAFEFEDVASGHCAATASSPGFATVTQSVELKDGQEASVNFELKLEKKKVERGRHDRLIIEGGRFHK